MPQTPLPALAARVQVPTLFSPFVQQFQQPPNVLPYMRYVEPLDAMGKGLKLGQAMMALPQEGRENAYQYMMAGIAKEHGAQLQKAIKDIQAQQNVPNNIKSEQITQLLARAGVTFGEQAATINAPAGLQAGIGAINATAANPGLNYGYPPPAPINTQNNPPGQGSDQELNNIRTGGSDYD